VGTPPILMLHGGPGGVGGIRTFSAVAARAPFMRRRDVVIIDERGAGFSKPALCPGYDSATATAYDMRAGAAHDSVLATARRACIAVLTREGDRRDGYSTAEIAADVIDLRRALGYKQWLVYGASYGAYLAQEVMHRDSGAVYAALLPSPMALGFSRHAEQPLVTQRAFERLFAECGAQPACRSAFPDPEADFDRAYDVLTQSPIAVPVGARDTVWVDGVHLVEDLRDRMGARAELRSVPLLLHELASGDQAARMRAAHAIAGNGALPSGFPGAALREIILCNDDEIQGARYRATLDSVNMLARAPFRRTPQRDCDDWTMLPHAPARRVAIRSGVPVLIISGWFDDRTPAEHARRIAATLSRATLVEMRDEGHDPRPSGCHTSLIAQFFTHPAAPLNTSCVARVIPIRFATTWDEIGQTERGRSAERR
jgi:pimeloyl-ACP methyl ester carboxylesterase